MEDLRKLLPENYVNNILGSVIGETKVEIKVKFAFVRNRNKKRVVLSTDLYLAGAKIVRVYGNR